MLQPARGQLPAVEVEAEEADDEQSDGPDGHHQDVVGVLLLLLGLHLRLVLAQLEVSVAGLEAVIFQLDCGVGQLGLAVLQREFQRLLLQLLMRYLVGGHI